MRRYHFITRRWNSSSNHRVILFCIVVAKTRSAILIFDPGDNTKFSNYQFINHHINQIQRITGHHFVVFSCSMFIFSTKHMFFHWTNNVKILQYITANLNLKVHFVWTEVYSKGGLLALPTLTVNFDETKVKSFENFEKQYKVSNRRRV